MLSNGQTAPCYCKPPPLTPGEKGKTLPVVNLGNTGEQLRHSRESVGEHRGAVGDRWGLNFQESKGEERSAVAAWKASMILCCLDPEPRTRELLTSNWHLHQ